MIVFIIIASVFTLTPNVIHMKCLDDYECLSPKPSSNCQKFELRGVGDKEKNIILTLHNEFRFSIARGSKKGYKQASNMMELTWDQNLADLAQQQADTCDEKNQEICSKCLMNDGIVQVKHTLILKCDHRQICHSVKKFGMQNNWKQAFETEIVNVALKHRVNVTSLSEIDKRDFGNVIAAITGKTDKIGCGHIAYKRDGKYTERYICNYSPGVKISEEVYKEGPYCSNCPPDTCCGSCDYDTSKRGLCHEKTETELNYEYTHPFNCNFNNERDCEFTATGTSRWETENRKEGGTLKTILNSGEKSTVTFTKRVISKEDFRILLEYKTGFFGESSDLNKPTPAVIKINLQYDQNEQKPMYIKLTGHCPLNVPCAFYTDLIKAGKYKISLDFSVTDAASSQYFLIYRIRVVGKGI